MKLKNSYRKKRILVYGKGRSGVSVKEFLSSCGAKVFLFEDGEKVNFDISKLDLVVISPGISFETPLCKEIKKLNIPIISELELGFLNVKGKIVAITGTNGKTTTVSLLAHVLNNGNAFLAGNIGLPLISLWDKTNENSLIICEVSSFQLEGTKNFKPVISAVLNLAPDHLERHKTMSEYSNCKARIFQNQTKENFCVLNYDDINVFNLAEKCNAKKYYFSINDQTKNNSFFGTFLLNDEIYYKNQEKIELIMKTAKIKLVGKKNLENVLAVCLIAKILKISNQTLEQKISNFTPLEHRMELVFENEKVRYINDSKATNVASAIADLEAISGKTVAIFGGSDKGEDFNLLFSKMPKNVVYLIFCGATREKLEEGAKHHSKENFVSFETLKEGIEFAKKYCESQFEEEKLNLILCPACASFDEFRNFEERGKFFKNYLINGENYGKN